MSLGHAKIKSSKPIKGIQMDIVGYSGVIIKVSLDHREIAYLKLRS